MPLLEPTNVFTLAEDTDSTSSVYDFNKFKTTETQQAFATKAQNTEDFALGGVPAAVGAVVAATIDTFGTSLGALEDNDVEDYLAKNLPSVGRFLEEHSGGVRLTADIAGSFLPAGLAIKGIRAGSYLNKLVNTATGKNLDKFFSTGLRNKDLFTKHLDEAGVLVNKNLRSFAESAAAKRIRSKAVRRSVADVAIESIAADAAIIATMNSSEFILPPENSIIENALFFGGFNAIFAGAGWAAARYTFNSTMTKLGKQAAAAQNPGALPIAAAFGAVNNRGPEATTFSMRRAEVQEELKIAQETADDELVQNLTKELPALEQQIMRVLESVANDSPIKGVTNSHSLETAERNTLLGANDELGYFGSRSLEHFEYPRLEEFRSAMVSKLETDKLKVNELQESLKQPVKGKAAHVVERNKFELQKLRNEISDNERTVQLVREIDGTVSGASTRQEMFQDGKRIIVKNTDNTTVDVDDIQLVADLNGNMRIPSTVILDEIPDISTLAIRATDHKSLLTSTGFTNEKSLRLQMDSLVGHEAVTVSDELLEFRRTLPTEPFTVYKAEGKFGLFSMVKNKEYKTPHSMIADDVYGMSAKGKLIATDMPNVRVTSKGFSQLSYKARTAALDLMQATVERVNPRTFKGFEISKSAHHTQTDYALQLLERYPELSQKIAAPGGLLRTKEGLEYQSLYSKFDEFRNIFHAHADELGAGLSENTLHLPTVARSLNLPVDDLSILEFFGGAISNTIKEKNPLSAHVKSLDEMAMALKSLAHAAQSAPTNTGMRWRGDMMNLSRERRPVIDLVRSTEESKVGISREKLREAVFAERDQTLQLLKTSPEAVIMQAGLNSLKGTEDAVKIVKEQLPYVIDGLRTEGVISKNIFTQEFRLRGTPTGKSIDLISDLWRKATDKQMAELFKPHATIINRLTHRANAGDLQLFMTARNALAKGWDVDPIPISVDITGAPKFQYKLLPNSDRNHALWARHFPGEQMPVGAMLPVTGNKGQNITVTQEAADALTAFNSLSQQVLKEYNATRRAKGLGVKQGKPFHLPPKMLAGKETVYLIDAAGTVRSVTAADTKAEAVRLAQKEIVASDESLAAVPSAAVQRHFEARSRAWFDLDDFSRPARQTASAKGTSVGEVVTGGVEEYRGIIRQLEHAFADVSRETRMFVFEPEVNFLKFQHAASGFADKEESTFSLLLNRILGTQQDTVDMVPRAVYGAVESSYDWLLQRLWDTKFEVAGRVGARREFEQIQDKLGAEFAPFSNFNEYLEKTARVNVPPSFKKHAAILNEFTTALTIRMFDVGMMVINTLSLATTLPPVVHALKPFDGEDTARWLERTGIFADHVGKGQVAKFSATKAAIGGIQFFYSKEGRQFSKDASKAGFFDQFAAEQVEFYGRTGESLVAGILRTVANKTSVLTDKSERFARAVSFMTFANMGKNILKLESDEAVMAFAHAQANNVIADFRPDNRPVIFQGAVGMPLGLFTTFLWNFLQRQYSMIESKQIGALVNQVGLQTAIFGAESYPGVTPFINTFTAGMGDGSENLVDRLNKSMGYDGAQLFLNGSLSTMTGISISPRAAIGIPGERGVVGAQSAAGVQYGSKVLRTMGQTVDSIMENEGLNSNEMMEIVARSNLNKGLSNAIELFGTGTALDAQGSIIESDTRTALGVGARALGFKPFFADELRQENRRNRTTDSIRNELKERLANTMKAKIRSGKFTSEDFELAMAHYVKAGGQPENFRRFFIGQIARGTTNKLDLEIQKALRNSSDGNRTARLLFLSE